MKARDISLLLLGLVLLFAPGAAAQTRHFLNGVPVPPDLLIPGHPAEKAMMPMARELLQHGWEKTSQHCNVLHASGRVGRVTLQSLTLVTLGVFPVSVFGGQFTAQDLKQVSPQDFPPERALIQHALRLSGGSTEGARRIVKAAEDHDAQCVRRYVNQANTAIDLAARQSLGMEHAREGGGMVFHIKRSGISTIIRNQVEKLRVAEREVAMLARNYDDVYKALNVQVAAAPAAQTPRDEPARPLAQPPVVSPPRLQQAPAQPTPPVPAPRTVTPAPVRTEPPPSQAKATSPPAAQAAPQPRSVPSGATAVSVALPRRADNAAVPSAATEMHDALDGIRRGIAKGMETCLLVGSCQ